MLDANADSIPGGNFIKSPEYQAYKAAALEWVAGVLRLDSGAAVPESEFVRYFNTYFFQPGDNKTTRANKMQARKDLMSAIGRIAPDATEPAQSAPDLQSRS